jgi:carbon starvation protein CstA
MSDDSADKRAVGAHPESFSGRAHSRCTPDLITQTATDVGEHTILNRAGGAPTLAVGMAQIMAQAFGGKALEAFWYHFAILFEALFILTAVDAGTRAGRFMIQDLLGHVYAPLGHTESVFSNVVATVLCVAGWGWFVYQGTVDPLGGNRTPVGDDHPDQAQARALCLGNARSHCLAVGLHAAAAAGTILAPAKSIGEMQRVAFNNYICGTLTVMFVVLVVIMVYFTVKMSLQALRTALPSAAETPPTIRERRMADAPA